MDMNYTYENYDDDNSRGYVFPNSRLYIHSSVYLPSSDIDPSTGMLRPDQPRRGRTQAMRQEYERLEREDKKLNEALQKQMARPGIRISLKGAILVVAAVSLVCGYSLLFQQGKLVERQKALNSMNKKIEEAAAINTEIAEKIAEASEESVICYAATRDLNMVSSKESEAVQLVAMDTRPLEKPISYNVTANISGSPEEPEQVTDVEATRIPAIASANAGYQ